MRKFYKWAWGIWFWKVFLKPGVRVQLSQMAGKLGRLLCGGWQWGALGPQNRRREARLWKEYMSSFGWGTQDSPHCRTGVTGCSAVSFLLEKHLEDVFVICTNDVVWHVCMYACTYAWGYGAMIKWLDWFQDFQFIVFPSEYLVSEALC